MAAVLRIMEGCSAKRRFDLIGNHELYNIRRSDLPSSGLRLSPEGTTFHSAHLGGMWEAIFLDPYEHALIGMKEGECGYDKAVEIMQSSNPNVLSSIGGGDWFAGLPEEKHRFVPYNGACSAEQVAWLDNALREATSNGRKVLIFTHVPLYAPATKLKTVVWNAEDVLSVLHKHQDAVVAVFAGHDHNGGYAVDSAGLHHITMNSPLTATPGSDCFAVLECHHDGIARFVAHGRACVESGTDGKGRAYSELILAKGFENTPEDGRLGTINSDDVAKLVAMGFEEEKAKLTLEAANGDVEQAAQLLVNACLSESINTKPHAHA